MSNFNFNVGDKVINLRELSLWSNVYHFEKFENTIIRTVQSANNLHFSVSNFDVTTKRDFYGSDLNYVYSQEDGSCLDYNPACITKLYHFERDRHIVVAHINKLYDEAMLTSDKADSSTISELESQIAYLQKRVESIKAGLRPTIKGDMPQKEFLQQRLEKLMAKLQ